MTVVTAFTPMASIAGGALIGLSAVLLMALHGRILGATGILSGLMRGPVDAEWRLRAALLAGMVASPALIALTTSWRPAVEIPVGTASILIGGVIVGLGVGFGGGCTSGHGVCGNARFSRRSLIATACFMSTAFATVFVMRHLVGA